MTEVKTPQEVFETCKEESMVYAVATPGTAESVTVFGKYAREIAVISTEDPKNWSMTFNKLVADHQGKVNREPILATRIDLGDHYDR